TMYTPLAIMTDFFSGWVPPRHLYTGDIYKVWGNLPYNTGDYQLHLLFAQLFPGYENAGFYRDERGFLTPAPYGEIADVLLSDTRFKILNRYTTLFISEETAIDLELYIKLNQFVREGGHIIIFINTVLKNKSISDYFCGQDYNELFKTDNNRDTVIENKIGKGRVSIINITESLEPCETAFVYKNNINEDIPHPYKFKPGITAFLHETFNNLKIISVDNPRLSYTLDIINANTYTLYVANNTLNTETYDILTSEGNILSVTELPITDGTETLPEFLPRGYSDRTMGLYMAGTYKLKPYDCRLYRIITEGIRLNVIAESNPKPRNKNLYLSLGYGEKSAKSYLLDNPTFAHHFGGIMLPAEYLDRMDDKTVKREAQYFNLQNIGIIVDFSHMINHFPDLTLIGNFSGRTAESIKRIERILILASKYRCEGAIFSLHRNAENEYSHQSALDGAMDSLRKINEICLKLNIKLYVQNRNVLISTDEQLSLFSQDKCAAIAFNTAFAFASGIKTDITKYNISMLMLSDIKTDIYGQKYAVNAPVYNGEHKKELKRLYIQATEQKIPVILCAEYKCNDEVTADLLYLSDWVPGYLKNY
ncbi:MAG: hypothetical protein PHZ09_07910, partial [Eubacteriales bacterium]|nr:hypothetical protein [Eubacteriales bacterium]